MPWQRLAPQGHREPLVPERLPDDLREVFEKVEQQDELRKRMRDPFPEFDFIAGVEAYVRHLKVGTRNLAASVTALMGTQSSEDAVKCYEDMTFFYFALLSAHLSLRDYLYSRTTTLRGTREFHDIVDEWKAAPVSQLILHLRNRVQHGAMLPGSLMIETRNENHPQGSGVTVLFETGDEFWKKVEHDLNRPTREYFESVVAPEQDKLTFLLSAYTERVGQLQRDIRPLFWVLYAPELRARDDLERNLAEVERWLSDHGVAEVAW